MSVANKQGVVEFARGLVAMGFEVVSSGGTARVLADAGVDVSRVSDVTGSAEILDGRVKTLHPKIHGGILSRRSAEDDSELDEHGISPVDVVAVNFYPFEKTVASGAPVADWFENIDIGGPSMLRAACKNFQHVVPVVDPSDYERVLNGLADGLALQTRLGLMRKAFTISASYERAIASAMSRVALVDGQLVPDSSPDSCEDAGFEIRYNLVQPLRYGENPHQQASFYRDPETSAGIAAAKKIHGKELSYNNILDLDAAWRLILELGREVPTAAVIKHTNPCGAALGETIADAYVRARACDPVSAFGSIVALNRGVDLETANEIATSFVEAVIAPAFSDSALTRLKKKKNLRLLEIDPSLGRFEGRDLRRVLGGLLVQDWDQSPSEIPFEVVSKAQPDQGQREELMFAWRVVKHVKSNAIVLVKQRALLGVGAGQMSRVDSCEIAVRKAVTPIEGAVAASDAFFPFRDGVDALGEAGVRAVIQPGGSVRDEEVIGAADERGLVLVFTGMRHFRH